MIKSTASLIGLLTLLITVLLPVLASQNIESNEFVTGMISYLFIVAMVIISILYKMNMEKKNSQCCHVNIPKRIWCTIPVSSAVSTSFHLAAD